ncbi:MAG TPA: 2TM domain-containing protein [Salinimicrobium sp.]|nr:2TM domain-containing protein [Salinimicrobium sp.]
MIPNKEKQRYEEAKHRVKRIRGFYIHLSVYILVNLFLLIVDNRNTSVFGFNQIDFSDFSTAFFWGIGLFCHWLSVFGHNLMFGKKWEERKIQEYMEKEKQERTRWE